MAKVGEPEMGSQTQACAKNSFGCPEGEENVDKRLRPVSGGAVQVDSCCAPRRDGGYEVCAKRDRSGVNG